MPLVDPDCVATTERDTLDQRLDYDNRVVCSTDEDRVSSTPSCQLSRIPSPLDEPLSIHDHQPDHNVEGKASMSLASCRLEFNLSSEDAAILEDHSLDNTQEEEKVNFDFGADDLDLSDSRLPTPSQVPSQDRQPDDRVQISDPYCLIDSKPSGLIHECDSSERLRTPYRNLYLICILCFLIGY